MHHTSHDADEGHLRCPFCAAYEVQRLYLGSLHLDSCAVRLLRGPLGRGPRQRRVPRPGLALALLTWPVATVAVCDLDGTLIDSDAALVAPFLALGVRLEDIGRGLPVAEECARHGISIEEFVAAYDTEVVQPYPGAPSWWPASTAGPCARTSTRTPVGPSWPGWAGSRRWRCSPTPSTVPRPSPRCSSGWASSAADVVFLGDTAHDRACAKEAGAMFALASWNPKAEPAAGDVVLERPEQLLELLGLA